MLISSIWFAFFVYFLPNPSGDLGAIQPKYSIAAFHLAADYSGEAGVEPEDVIGTLLAEHGGERPDKTDSVGAAGELGLFQIVGAERREYNREHGTDYTAEDLFDWRVNMTIAVWVIHDDKHTHRVRRPKRCRGGDHTWLAHYVCAVAVRDRCPVGYRARLIRRLGGWRLW